MSRSAADKPLAAKLAMGRIRREEDHPRPHRQEGMRGLELYDALELLDPGPQLPLLRGRLPVLRRSNVDDRDVNQLLLATPPGKGAPPRVERNYAYT